MAEALKSPHEQRVLLENVGWQTYEQLLQEREERRTPRFFYDRGVLEIVSPSTEHEAVADVVASLVKELAVVLGIDVFGAGSTTFRREDLGRGFEPDQSFYFLEKAGLLRGKKNIDLSEDPPPDLVVEVDLTSPSLNKLPIYARLGIPEVWRYAGGRPEILVLSTDSVGYHAAAESPSLPSLTSEVLARFLEEGLSTPYPAWARAVREWAQG